MVSGKAKANPTKAFFVRMLTRDISLDDCILDLVDNSIDGAWKSSGADPSSLGSDTELSPYRIDIDFTSESFSIQDNCGGITFDDAVDYAFTFGRAEFREEDPHDDVPYSVGVYGIGMKRAVFKLGNVIQIASTFNTPSGDIDSFLVPINVPDWLSDRSVGGEWDFDIEPRLPDETAGVTITVEELTDETAGMLSSPSYEVELRRILSRDYMIPLRRGLKILVNGTAVSGLKLNLRETIEVASSESAFRPLRIDYDDTGVRVEIIAGMNSKPPDEIAPDEGDRVPDRSGWYLFCNGRAVLAADRTSLSGWGVDSLPKWHGQYSGFVGLVFFSSRHPELLPMTTTKRNVDVSSPIYRRSLPRMSKPTRSWIDYTNARKQDESLRSLEDKVTDVDLADVKSRKSLEVPQSRRRPPPSQRVANVNYAVPLARLRALARAFGNVNMNYRDVGLEAFEYSYLMRVTEEDP